MLGTYRLAYLTLGVSFLTVTVHANPSPSTDKPPLHNWYVEMGGAFFLEAWDLNEHREQLVGGKVLLARDMGPNRAIGVQTALLHVVPSPGQNAFLPTWSFVLRQNLIRFSSFSILAEGSGGLSYASTQIPKLGTRFNFVSQVGLGLQSHQSANGQFITGFHWLHVSNNSLNGSSRNPDIQAIGIYLGWRLP